MTGFTDASGVVTLLVGHRTCDSRVAGPSNSRASSRSSLVQATHTCVSLLRNSIIIIPHT